MEVVNDIRNGKWYVKEKLSNGQTLLLEFYLYDQTDTNHKWTVVLSVYSKRKHCDSNLDNVVMTGTNPWESVTKAMEAFNLLEKEVVNFYNNTDNIIFCDWSDNKRRDAYYKFLHKKGYEYGNIDSCKCLMKVFKKGTQL